VIADPYDPRANAETFDLHGWLATFDARLLGTSEGRRILTEVDPLLFAYVYLRHHLTDESTGGVTFSDMHLDLARQARSWMVRRNEPATDRDAYIAPRGSGKSTWLFTILPMWAAAHGHRKFIAAFANTPTQAEQHLLTFKGELTKNALLQVDYPDLVQQTDKRKHAILRIRTDQNGGDTRLQRDLDRQSMYVAKSGFAFAARGIDSSTLGMKVGATRPDLLILDDIEPDEANYSANKAEKRLGTLLDAILPLNVWARVLIVGTTTMPGSIMHQLVQAAEGTEVAEWIRDEHVKVHHYRAIVRDDDGHERSMWPAKWAYSYLASIRHTRSYAKNFDCDPMAADGDYWTTDDIVYGALSHPTRTCLWVDPAVTSKETSDETGLAVVSWEPTDIGPGRCCVRHAEGVRLQPDQLRSKVASLIERYPEIRVVIVEANQGGDAWLSIFHHLPVKVVTRHSSEPKEVRAARTLDHYQQGRVVHEQRHYALEAQMIGFPKMAHDDVLDAAMGGILSHLHRTTKRTTGRTAAYA
jgi:phage terminase large subunit-like protein